MSAIMRHQDGGYGVELVDGKVARFRSKQWAAYFVDQLNLSITRAQMERDAAKVREITARAAQDGVETMSISTSTPKGNNALEREFLAQHGNPRVKDITVTVLPNPGDKR